MPGPAPGNVALSAQRFGVLRTSVGFRATVRLNVALPSPRASTKRIVYSPLPSRTAYSDIPR